jgi:hypothetical protein
MHGVDVRDLHVDRDAAGGSLAGLADPQENVVAVRPDLLNLDAEVGVDLVPTVELSPDRSDASVDRRLGIFKVVSYSASSCQKTVPGIRAPALNREYAARTKSTFWSEMPGHLAGSATGSSVTRCPRRSGRSTRRVVSAVVLGWL